MKVVPGNAQHIGSRETQQDDFGFTDLDDRDFTAHAGVLAVLTDGMGGLAMGAEASRLAKRTMLDEYQAKAAKEAVPQALERALRAANNAVFQIARKAGLEGDVGTTMVAAVVRGADLYWVSVGDSRIYLCRDGQLTQLTTDHVYSRQLAGEVAKGRMSKEEAAGHPDRDALTSFLGLEEIEEIDRNVRSFPLQPGDRILLCSDGLYRALSAEEIAERLADDPQNAAESLVERAVSKERRYQDNLTVAILACELDAAFTKTARSVFGPSDIRPTKGEYAFDFMRSRSRGGRPGKDLPRDRQAFPRTNRRSVLKVVAYTSVAFLFVAAISFAISKVSQRLFHREERVEPTPVAVPYGVSSSEQAERVEAVSPGTVVFTPEADNDTVPKRPGKLDPAAGADKKESLGEGHTHSQSTNGKPAGDLSSGSFSSNNKVREGRQKPAPLPSGNSPKTNNTAEDRRFR